MKIHVHTYYYGTLQNLWSMGSSDFAFVRQMSGSQKDMWLLRTLRPSMIGKQKSEDPIHTKFCTIPSCMCTVFHLQIPTPTIGANIYGWVEFGWWAWISTCYWLYTLIHTRVEMRWNLDFKFWSRFCLAHISRDSRSWGTGLYRLL